MEHTPRTYRTALLLTGALALGGCSSKIVDGSVEDAGFTCFATGVSSYDYRCVERRPNGERLTYWFDLSQAARDYSRAKRNPDLDSFDREKVVQQYWLVEKVRVEIRSPGGLDEILPTPQGSAAEGAAILRTQEFARRILDKQLADDTAAANRILGR